MTTLAIAALLHASAVAGGSHPYTDAHRVSTRTGKPMVVMVSAEWCGPCQKMQKTVLPQVKKQGLLQKVSFAIVNVDRERKLARKLTGGGPVPQLVMFRRSGKGWLRRKLVGGQSVQAVEKFIQEGITRDEVAKKDAAKQPTSDEKPAEAKVAKRPQTRPASKR